MFQEYQAEENLRFAQSKFLDSDYELTNNNM